MLLQSSASGVAGGQVRIAIRLALLLAGIAASFDRLEQVETLLIADNDVIAARINGVTGLDDYLAVTVAAYHFQAADRAYAVQIPVVQALFGEHVINFAVQLGFTDQLSCKKAWPLQALQPGARRTRARYL
jgi:hypothetical protein